MGSRLVYPAGIQAGCSAGGTFPEFSFNWSESERKYLLKHLARITVAPISDDPEDITLRSVKGFCTLAVSR